jgi:hypothetical protein
LKPLTADLVLKHNNQQQKQSFAMMNERWALNNKADRTGTSNNQPKKVERFANLLVFLVFLVSTLIIIILSSNFASNSITM